MSDWPLLSVVLRLLLVVLAGWLFVIGKPILLPVLIAIIVVYLLSSCVAVLRGWPVFRLLPPWALHVIVLAAFSTVLFGLGLAIAVTVRQMIDLAPVYQKNIEGLVSGLEMLVMGEKNTTWQEIRAVTVDRVDLPSIVGDVLGGLTSTGVTMFLVIVYAAFIAAEQAGFRRKLAAAFPEGDRADRLAATLAGISRNIGHYLAVKTGINIVLGLLSLAVLLLFGVDFALFWALAIGLLNYIPYVGSYVGVAFPVVLSVAQFGDPLHTVALAASLGGAQLLVGNVLEPNLIGRQLNLSPFVVLLALTLWSALWGLAGAILAIPMTSILVIVLASFRATRFAAVLLSGDPRIPLPGVVVGNGVPVEPVPPLEPGLLPDPPGRPADRDG